MVVSLRVVVCLAVLGLLAGCSQGNFNGASGVAGKSSEKKDDDDEEEPEVDDTDKGETDEDEPDQTDEDTGGADGSDLAEDEAEIECEVVKDAPLAWNRPPESDLSHTRFRAEYTLSELAATHPRWMSIYIVADGAPGNPASLKVGPTEFSNPADGTWKCPDGAAADDSLVRLTRAGKWTHGVSYPCALTEVRSGTAKITYPLVFKADISKAVQVQDAQLLVTYCE